MFKNKSDKINPETTDTLIGEGTTFEGKLKTEASIRIDGSIIGDIESSGMVTIGENGNARSNVKARSLHLAGKMTGDAEIEGTLTILSTGCFIGNLSAGSLVIEAGGTFKGTSTMAVKTAPAAASAKD